MHLKEGRVIYPPYFFCYSYLYLTNLFSLSFFYCIEFIWHCFYWSCWFGSFFTLSVFSLLRSIPFLYNKWFNSKRFSIGSFQNWLYITSLFRLCSCFRLWRILIYYEKKGKKIHIHKTKTYTQNDENMNVDTPSEIGVYRIIVIRWTLINTAVKNETIINQCWRTSVLAKSKKKTQQLMNALRTCKRSASNRLLKMFIEISIVERVPLRSGLRLERQSEPSKK